AANVKAGRRHRRRSECRRSRPTESRSPLNFMLWISEPMRRRGNTRAAVRYACQVLRGDNYLIRLECRQSYLGRSSHIRAAHPARGTVVKAALGVSFAGVSSPPIFNVLGYRYIQQKKHRNTPDPESTQG